MRSNRALATLAIAGLTVFGVAACSGDPATEETTAPPPASDSASPTEEAAKPTKDASEAAAEPSDGSTPDWAKPATIVGDLLTTIEGDGFRVDVYQVGTTAATKASMFVDSRTEEPIVDVGDEIVYVNYVLTNTGTEPITLSSLLVDVDARYADWEYYGSTPGISDLDLDEQMGVTSDPKGPDASGSPYIWEPGHVFSFGDNLLYKAGSPVVFDAELIPMNEDGDLLHDEAREASAESTFS